MAYPTLISADALARERQPSWVLVDCRYTLTDPEQGRHDYLASHIPGAVHASLSHDLSAPPNGRNGRHSLPSADVIKATFSHLGIGAGTQVVAYDQDSGMFAARLWWMARFMGHDAVAVLDGGLTHWTQALGPLEKGAISPTAARFTGEPRTGWARAAVEVEATLGDDTTLLIDARSPDRFAGENETIDRVGGHIPGAVNHHFLSNLSNDGTFLPVEALRARFASALAGRRPDTVICYCGSGVTACHNLLAMAHAGLDGASLFVGSWSEWSSDPSRPRETGPAR